MTCPTLNFNIEDIDHIEKLERDLGVINFTEKSFHDEIVFNKADQELAYTLTKKVHNTKINQVYQILSKDIISLNDDNWLTDTIIETYLKTLVSSCKLYILTSVHASSICAEGVTKASIRKPLDEYDYIAVV